MTELTLKEKIVYPISFFLKKQKSASNTVYKQVQIWGNGSQSENTMPKIIWLFWDEEPIPYLVNICKAEVARLNPNYQIIFLTKKNVKQYLPEFLIDESQIPPQKYANLIRLQLLIEYGGIWMDATSIPLASFDSIFETINYNLHDVLLTKADYFTSDLDYPIFENWFIASSPRNQLLIDWYDKTYQSIMDEPEYLKTLNKSVTQNISDTIYLKMLVGLQQVIRANKNYRINYLSSLDFGFNYGYREASNGLDLKYAIKMLCFNKAPMVQPLFCKFTGGGHLLKQMMEHKLINSKSIMGLVLARYKGLFWIVSAINILHLFLDTEY